MQARVGAHCQLFAIALYRLQFDTELFQIQFGQRTPAGVGLGAKVDRMHHRFGQAFAVDRAGLGALIERLEHAVAGLAYFVDACLYVLHGQAKHDQCMGGEHQTRFEQLRYNSSCTGCTQLFTLTVITGTHQDLYLGVTFTSRFEHAHGDVGFIHGNHQQACALKADGAEQFAAS
ncbi:hypothetical protein D3C84_890160 [compost metagenome]